MPSRHGQCSCLKDRHFVSAYYPIELRPPIDLLAWPKTCDQAHHPVTEVASGNHE